MSRDNIKSIIEALYKKILREQEGVCRICSFPPAPGKSLVLEDTSSNSRPHWILICEECNKILDQKEV